MPEIRGIAEATRTSVRKLSGSREDRVPQPPAASARFGGRQTAETLDRFFEFLGAVGGLQGGNHVAQAVAQ